MFPGRTFRGSKKPQNFCIIAELNFAVHVLQQISREFDFVLEWKFRFSILIKNNFTKRKERNGENWEKWEMKIKFSEVYFGNNSLENQ